ncbi:Polyisoprenoid-binding protein YceI [Mesonia phycicola]|uniref:Polyisoprenoid-binding protein YceI n=1 Tax=Mesonia phycicola TaxID=579105 RepID=A0A1M6ARM5_9FLAO|nr:YceI family protein [Mesonia phycicola]SHI38853.1 Polyisoprenoid-binding protein YceI [Mesonia phycicola]
MKKVFLNMFMVAALGVSVISCKNEVKNETEAKEAEEVTEVTDEAAVYIVSAEESKIEWLGAKPTGSHNGTINVKEGEILLGNDIVEGGHFVIDMKSIAVEDLEGDQKESLESHLMGTVEGKEGDFFNVQKYPEADFEITNVENKDGKTWLNGNLTLKETTKNISIPVFIETTDEGITLSSETFTIDRTNWNINYGSKSVFDNLGDKFIKDDIELKVTLKGKKS